MNNASAAVFVNDHLVENGNVTVENNTAETEINIIASTVDGNLTAENNTAGADIFIQDNTIKGNLQCEGNDPDPTVSGNTVDGTTDCAD